MAEQNPSSLDESEYTLLRRSIKDLETEIDEAYDKCHKSPAKVEGIEPSPQRSSVNPYSQSYQATPTDSPEEEPVGANVDKGSVTEPRRVAFHAAGHGQVPSCLRARPLDSSTPADSIRKSNPPSYHTRIDRTLVTPELSGQYSEPKPIVMPEPYDGVSSLTLEDWLTNFEICSRINGWTESQKCSFLAVKLRGAALHVFTDLPVEDRNQYFSVVQALRNRFDRSSQTELYKVQLRARVRKPGENLSELASAIRRLTNRAYPSVSIDVRDDLAKDQFLEALDSRHTRLQVRRQKPRSLDEALSLAIEEEVLVSLEEKRAGSGTAEGYQTIHCYDEKSNAKPAQTVSGIAERQPDSDRFAELNKKIDDLTKIVNSLKYNSRKSSQSRDTSCWICHKQGHFRANCPNRNVTKDFQTKLTDLSSASQLSPQSNSGN